ncbi:hypothetical protein BpHYR1_042581 [Brachionus plicatilis]|uniref:Uncharacterized protein n=1 Tax=Brachionus plicatilis TaxID=10195 RepID=A0A3M7QRU0_BRAPC|nr:hypothetical protein BpHYR1_042581 [Brachionus plicatilis]
MIERKRAQNLKQVQKFKFFGETNNSKVFIMDYANILQPLYQIKRVENLASRYMNDLKEDLIFYFDKRGCALILPKPNLRTKIFDKAHLGTNHRNSSLKIGIFHRRQ